MIDRPHLTRYASQDVTLLGDTRRPGGVTLAFTERTGGQSLPPYDSLNLSDDCGDDERAVAANRQQLLEALGIGHLADRLINPVQVHGDQILVVRDSSDAAQAGLANRPHVDAVVCAVPDVPVLLLSADCVSVILVAPGAFAVVHSGWKGTKARIAQKALRRLVELAGCAASDVLAYVGPHIKAEDYEVSEELTSLFAGEFGQDVLLDPTHLDLGCAVSKTLVSAGMRPEAIVDELPSTASCTQRFYSYRVAGGICGRHGALAVLTSDHAGR